MNWDSGLIPTASDVASFNPNYHTTSYTVSNPTIPGTVPALALELNNNFLGGTFDFSGPGTIRLSGGPMTARGFGTYSFTDPRVDFGGSYLDVGTDANVTLRNHSVFINLKALLLRGGTFTLDDSGGYIPRLPITPPIEIAGGTLGIIGDSANTSTYKLGPLMNGPGFNTVDVAVNPAGIPQAVTFDNTGAFSLRNNTFMATRFTASGGGFFGGVGSGDAKIAFSGVPNTGPAVGPFGARLLSHTAGGLDVGFATVTDGSGTTYAAWEPSLGVVAALPTLTTSVPGPGPGTLAASTGSDFTQFNAPAGPTTAVSSLDAAVIRITPSGPGSSLDMSGGPFNIITHGIMLDGPDDFHIHGNPGHSIGSPSTDAPIYYYINNPNTVLGTDMVIGTQAGSTNIVGPGFLELTGVKQNDLNNPKDHRLNLLGGVLRATDPSIGFNGGQGTIAFRGGVLEILKGSNGNPLIGGTADFNRKLDYNNNFGTVNWSSTDAGDNFGGSGGFSAYGSDASVNIDGSPTPSTMTWNVGGSGFVMDGYALKFGSVKSDSTLTWYNPINLGFNTSVSASSGFSYAAREFIVTQGTGSPVDKTVMAGVISGPPITDLIKSGTGTMELAANNNYEGGTIIEEGTVRAANPTGPSLHSTRQVIINSHGTLLYGYDKQIANASTPITMVGVSTTPPTPLNDGSTLNTDGHSDTVGTLTLSGNSVLDLGAGNSIYHFQKSNSIPWTGTLSIWNWSGTAVTGGGIDQVYFDAGGTSTGLTGLQLSQINFYSGSGTGFLGNAVWATNPDEITVSAIPEPSTVLAGLALVGLVGFRERRRFAGWVGKSPTNQTLAC